MLNYHKKVFYRAKYKMAEIGDEKKSKPDIFCHGMLIYPAFYQHWVDSYVKCSIIYKRKDNQQQKS